MKSVVTRFFASMALLFMLGVVESRGGAKFGTYKYKGIQWSYSQQGSSDACSVRPISIKEEMEVPCEVKLIGGGVLKVRAIADGAFREQKGLKKITIPGSVRAIGKEAFFYCESLAEVHFSEGLDSIAERAFCNCKNLRAVVFPSSLRSIGREAFSNCPKIQAFGLREGVEYIGDGAFEYCDALQAVEVPSTVKTLPNKAFLYCKSLERIELHEGLDSIGSKNGEDGVFVGCESLRAVMIPSTVKSISMLSFADCKSLTRVYIPSAARCEFGESIFDNCDLEKLEVYVPELKVDSIKQVKEMEAIAKNIKGGYIVTFTAAEGVPLRQVQLVAKGECAMRPYAPVRPGYRLAGWQKDGAAYDFSAAVTGDITLEGVWKAADKELSYDRAVLDVQMEGKEQLPGSMLAEGDELAIAMRKAGVTFKALSVNGTQVEGAQGRSSCTYTVRAEDARVVIGFEVTAEASAVESQLLAGARVWENHAGEVLMLEGVEAAVSVEVYSLLGSRVYAKQLRGDSRMAIDASGWAAGVYVVRVAARDGAKAMRMVKR